MALIKSALEIALERTKDMKADPASLRAFELKQEGQKLAGEFLADPASVDLEARVKAVPKEERSVLKAAIFSVLAARIQLPLTKAGIPQETLDALAKGFSALSPSPFPDKRIGGLIKQIGDFLARYLDDASNLDAALRKQFEPKLRRKEQELAARTGQSVRLDPLSDPEFLKVYQQNVGHLKSQYQSALDRAKEDLAAMLGIEKE
ncbi:MAG: hypothetical protein GX430_07535 [Treponema sp.]|nr:hypothetical protein [Treponema sp.]